MTLLFWQYLTHLKPFKDGSVPTRPLKLTSQTSAAPVASCKITHWELLIIYKTVYTVFQNKVYTTRSAYFESMKKNPQR